MPKITPYEYQAKVSGAIDSRRASGEDFGTGASLAKFGGAVGDFGEALAKRSEQIETSELSAKMAQAHADYTEDFEKRLKDPKSVRDPAFAENFLSDFDKSMEDVRNEVKTAAGQRYFTESYGHLRNNMQKTAFAGQSELAGVQAKENYNTFKNAKSSVLVRSPSSYNDVVADSEAYLNNLSDNKLVDAKIVSAMRMELNRDLAVATMDGLTKGDLNYAKKQLDDGRFDKMFDADVKQQMYGRIDTERRGRIADANAAYALDERRKKEHMEVGLKNGLELLDKNELTWDFIKDPKNGFDFAHQNLMMHLMVSGANGALKPNDSALADATVRMHLPDGDPNKITDQRQLVQMMGEKQISYKTFAVLSNQLQNNPESREQVRLMNNVVEEAKKGFMGRDANGLLVDPEGPSRFNQWYEKMLASLNEEKSHKRSGADLFTFGNPKYVGGDKITKFKRSQTEILNSMTKNIGGVQPPSTSASDPSQMNSSEKGAIDQYLNSDPSPGYAPEAPPVRSIESPLDKIVNAPGGMSLPTAPEKTYRKDNADKIIDWVGDQMVAKDAPPDVSSSRYYLDNFNASREVKMKAPEKLKERLSKEEVIKKTLIRLGKI